MLALTLLLTGFGVAFAQDDVTVDGPGTPRPGHIHDGNCTGGGLGDVVYALNNLTIDQLAPDATSDAGNTFVGADTAHPLYASQTTLDVSLEEITGSPHAINFHLSADEIGTYIACGEIGGFVRDGSLSIGLVPVDGSAGGMWAGSAVLTDNGDNTTDVLVELVELSAPASGESATPAATPD